MLASSATGYLSAEYEDYFVAPRRPERRSDCLTAEQIIQLPTYNPETDGIPVDGVNCERPCPYVSCRHHLYLEVHPDNGSIKINWKNVEIEQMPDTCALDVADRGALTLRQVGRMFDLTRERIRQLETKGMRELSSIVRAMSDEE